MTEQEFWTLIVGLLRAQFEAFGINAIVQRGYQPTQQGAPDPAQPVIILHSVNSRRYGFQGRQEVYNAETGLFDVVESWWLEQTIQVGALVPVVDPASPPTISAYDLLDRVSGMLQSYHSRRYLLGYGVGFYRIDGIRTPYFVDDMGRYEMSPSFDLTMTYRNTLTYAAPKIDAIESDIQRV